MRKVTGLRCLYAAVAAVTFGVSAESVRAQDEAPLPASPAPPPEEREWEKAEKSPPHPLKSPTVDELLQTLRLTRADVEQLKTDKRQRELPAAAEEPPELKELRKLEQVPTAPILSPDLNELIEKINQRPGGADRLERARRSGARLPVARPSGPAVEPTPNRVPGPRVEASVLGFETTGHQTTLKVSRNASYQYLQGMGTLSARDIYPVTSGTMGPSGLWGPLYQEAGPHAIVGSINVRPYLSFQMTLASSGWYVINLVATKGRADLRKGGLKSGSPPMFPLVHQWDTSTSLRDYESYPYLVNLAAGVHYFYWVPEMPKQFVYVAEVSLTRI